MENSFWVKGDMVNTLGWHRLDLLRLKKDSEGKRVYQNETVSAQDLKRIRQCVLRSIGLTFSDT